MPKSIVAATELPEPAQEEPVREFLTFNIRREAFGVPLTGIHEILGIRVLTTVPRAPAYVLGVCTVRGELVTVLDTGNLLQVTGEERLEGRRRILLTEAPDGEKLGLMVDEVTGVRRLLDSQIESTEAALVRDISPHLESVGRQDGTVTVLINLDSLVASTGPGMAGESL